MSTAGTIEILAGALAEALAPLARRLSPEEVDGFFARLGLQFPSSLTEHPGLLNALQGASSIASQLSPLAASLSDAININDVTAILTQGTTTLSKLGEMFSKLDSISVEMGALAGAFPGIPPSEISTFATSLPRAIMDLAIVEHLERMSPEVTNILAIAGVIDRHTELADPADPTTVMFEVKRLKLNNLIDLLSTPTAYVKKLYGWGNPSFDGKFLIEQLAELAGYSGLPALINPGVGGTMSVDMAFFEIAIDTTTSPPGLRIDLRVPIKQDFSNRVPLSQSGWLGEIKIKGKFDAGLVVHFTPPSSISLTAPAGTLTGSVSAGFAAEMPNGTNFTLVGVPGGTRLEAQSIVGSLHLDLAWDAGSNSAKGEPSITFEIVGGRLILDVSSGDSFVKTLSGGTKSEIAFDLSANWTPKQGIRFDGSSSLEIAVPTHITVGPAILNVVYVMAGLEPSAIPLELSAAISSKLGPLSVSIDRIGLLSKITFPSDKGNLGPLNIGFEFKPPNGVGLSVNTGIVQGAGFLYIDTDRGEYAGALELVFADFLSLHAIGLITTKMPDGSSGFSLLVIITADFGLGIQLGFGFTLLAVGGLLGLNRIMLLQPLMDGVRTGAIDSIMFPQNVVANAPRIISDLRAIFPPQQDTFLIGPMAKLGWGEPTLVSLSLGVIIEIPGDIAILGVLKLALPADDIALIVIQVNFAGAIEFDKKRMYFFASLYDSRVLFITIQGEMGVLFSFGDDANFVISVGGFHPLYHPPPLPFPSPHRIQVDIINESYARIRCDGYFAITSDSVQFGSYSEFFFGFRAFNVSGHAGFDAVLQFSPFHFVVSFSSSFSVQVFDVGVYGVDIGLTVEGPAPWHAHGTASLSLFLLSIDIGIDFTWGDSRDTSLLPITVMPLLAGELGKQSNWRAALPVSSHLLVTLRQMGETESAFVLHPVGTLRISQRAVPLDLTLDKVGNQKPSDANRFALTVTSAGLAKTAELQEQFAPSQFQNFDDATKLSQPGYEPMDSGIELSAVGTSLASGTANMRVVRYDLTVIDTKNRRYTKRFFSQIGALFTHFLGGASVTKCEFSAYHAAQMQPVSQKVVVGPETFAVALRSNNTVFGAEAAAFTSQAAAHDYLNRTVAGNPSLAEMLHVLPQFEVAP